MMAEAFDLAEKYRHPVLIASDAPIGQMIEAVEIPEFVEHDINKFDWTIKGCKKGCEQRKIQNVYYTHPDYEGYLSSKYAQMEEEEQRYENIQVEDAEVVLVAYGISSRVSREAVEIARAQGFKLGLIRPITLWPFPKKAFEEAKEAKAFLTVEMNILGQMVDDVKLATEGKYPVDHYGSIFEIPETDGIIAKAKEMLKKGRYNMRLVAPETITFTQSGFCPGCGHGLAVRLIAEVMEEMGLSEQLLAVVDVACGSLNIDSWRFDTIMAYMEDQSQQQLV